MLASSRSTLLIVLPNSNRKESDIWEPDSKATEIRKKKKKKKKKKNPVNSGLRSVVQSDSKHFALDPCS